MNLHALLCIPLCFALEAYGLDAKALSSEDEIYLRHSATVPIPGIISDQEEIVRFEVDVTGDQIAEVFYTRASYRDGKQGNVWSVYERTGTGSLLSLIHISEPTRPY